MTTANARKGAETERMVAKYLRENGFPEADRRLREGRNDDQGDIDGVPYTTIQVKYWAVNRLQAWVNDTLKQRDTADTSLCLLVVRTKYRAVEGWDAYMPTSQLADLRVGPETEAWTWVRMDLRLAVTFIKAAIKADHSMRSVPSSATTWTHGIGRVLGTTEWFDAPSTESESPPSPTT